MRRTGPPPFGDARLRAARLACGFDGAGVLGYVCGKLPDSGETMTASARLLLPLVAALGCGDKNVAPAPPPVGWHQEEGWTAACYYPPDWGKMADTDRMMARGKALDGIMEQWSGKRADGVSFDENMLENVETVLLGRPEKIEAVVQENLNNCKQTMGAGAGTTGWEDWVRSLPGKLTAGECLSPLDYTMFDYLDIGTGWQRPLPICKGDRVRISGTVADKYRISDKGPWITVEGDTGAPATGGSLPCNIEGCLMGQLVARFVSEDGIESVFPVGSEKVFTAPAHGELSYRINDDTFFDNTWFKSGSIIDHTAIEISPVE
jgi:hypothetical protein